MDELREVAEGAVGTLTVDLDRYERDLRAQGFERIAGVDEAGRGALAGPLVAAAVILPERFDLDGIRDGKRLSPNQRDKAFERIVARAVFSVCWAEPGTIDRHGLDRCNLRLLRRAAHKLDPEPDYVLIDGSVPVPWIRFPSMTIVRGDAGSASIAAASIVAKVTRDRIMDRLHRRFPEWGFDHDRGYGPHALEALDRLGPTPVHRLSIARVGQIAPRASASLTGRRLFTEHAGSRAGAGDETSR